MAVDGEIRPHPGPQSAFLASPADVAIFGGAAGGGKSLAMLIEPLRHIHVRGFNAVIFRRTATEVMKAGALWDEASEIYPHFGGKMNVSQLEWRFPAGSKIAFGHVENEKDKVKWHGSQICLLCFDELTTFSETQFFYLFSRNRSTCGVRPYIRATCNPDARSWVAEFIAWWIADTGLPDPARAGVLRWMAREGGQVRWANAADELPNLKPKSVTFVPAKLSDNPTLSVKDPGYLANLMALPRVERARLLDGNWKVTEQTVIPPEWLRSYTQSGASTLQAVVAGESLAVDSHQMRRFAVIDTAGTSHEKAEEKRGKPPSWSVAAIFDYWQPKDVIFVRHVWRDRVGWNALKSRVPEILSANSCRRVYVENAHHGPALYEELRGVQRELIGPVLPGMTDSGRGAKLERAVASRLLSRLEDGRFLVPAEAPWKRDYVAELTTWSGLPDETADQIDVSSYASYICRKQAAAWGGVITVGKAR